MSLERSDESKFFIASLSMKTSQEFFTCHIYAFFPANIVSFFCVCCVSVSRIPNGVKPDVRRATRLAHFLHGTEQSDPRIAGCLVRLAVASDNFGYTSSCTVVEHATKVQILSGAWDCLGLPSSLDTHSFPGIASSKVCSLLHTHCNSSPMSSRLDTF